jgi:N-acetyl-anhydromuramyl-L-alanine amidase AmpD
VLIPGIPYIQGRNAYSDRDSRKYGIAIHCTANTASARAEASYATRRTDGVSGHFYVDDVEVIQSLDTRARAGHAGSVEGNDHAIAVEITGLVSWSRAKWLKSVAWDKLGRVLAHIIQKDPHFAGKGFQVRRASVDEMRRNPKVQALYGHDDMRRAWGGTTHTDPGPNFPWDRLFQAINDALEGDMPTAEEIAAAVWSHDPTNRNGKGAVRNRDWRADAKTNPCVQPRFAVEDIWDHTHRIEQELQAARLRDEAILAAVQGLDTAAILARIDEHAARAVAERAELMALVESVSSGERDAVEVVRLIGELLSSATRD